MTTSSDCKQAPGAFMPVIDRNRCEGKGPCIEVCPVDVLAMGRLSRQDRQALSFIGRLKALAHSSRQAFVIAPERCQACGACVQACPEQAITLARAA